MSLIEAKNISMSYEGKKVLDSVSFAVDEGDSLLILGENGSGKTTLMKALTGLKKIDSGNLLFADGIKLKKIGYLPQQTDIQRDFPATAGEVVLSGCINRLGLRPFYTKAQRLSCAKVMERLEIARISQKCYHELSGGQQQKVLLARALCASENILVLDEPTTGLDAGASKEFYLLVSRLNREGMTVIMISHDVQNALCCANKVLHLGDAGASFFGSVDDYRDAFLGGKEGGI